MTDRGRIRSNNEDFFVINWELNLYVVVDGRGGHNGEEVGGEEACKVILSYFKENNMEDILWGALQLANTTVINMAEKFSIQRLGEDPNINFNTFIHGNLIRETN